MLWWNAVLIILVVALGALDFGSLPVREHRELHSLDASRCIAETLQPFISREQPYIGPVHHGELVACLGDTSYWSADLRVMAALLEPCVRRAVGIPQEPTYAHTVERVVHYCLITGGIVTSVDIQGVGWAMFHTFCAVLFAVLVWGYWPETLQQRWKPVAWLILTVTTRIASAILAFISFSDMLALGLHFVRTGWLHGIFGLLAVLVFCTGLAFNRWLPRKLHQEIDIDLQHPDRAPVRHSEIRPKFWSFFEEAAPNPRVDRGPQHRRVRQEALFGVQPQFVEPVKSAAVVAQRLDNGDYRHLGVCFRVGDKGVSVLHNLLAGGHDSNSSDITNLVVLHGGVSATIGEFHTIGPMKQGRNKGEIITFKWPTALDAVKSSRLVISPTPASQLMILTLDRNGRGDRYKVGGASKVSYDKGEYIYHFDTLPGDSGSPLSDESGAVRGIHYGGSGRGNIGIAFVSENFPTFKDYLQTPWGQVADMAEPRGQVVQEAQSRVVSIDCCESQKILHLDRCGCNGETKCTFYEPCPVHNVSSPKPEAAKQKVEPVVKKVVVVDRIPDVQPESRQDKGKGPAHESVFEIIQEQLLEITRIQRLQARQIERAQQVAEEAAQQRIQTSGVKNVKKGYKKGPTKDPVEEAVSSADEQPRKRACAYCEKPGHNAQQCHKLKRDRAQKPESKPAPKKEKASRGAVQSDREESGADSSGNELVLQRKAGGGQSKRAKGKKPGPSST